MDIKRKKAKGNVPNSNLLASGAHLANHIPEFPKSTETKVKPPIGRRERTGSGDKEECYWPVKGHMTEG